MTVINLSAKIGNILEDFSAKICMTLHDHSESEIIHVAYENIHWVLIVKAKLLERSEGKKIIILEFITLKMHMLLKNKEVSIKIERKGVLTFWKKKMIIKI